MSLAKAVISGTVYRAPEKRFTSNNVPISAFAMNISDTEETLVRVIAKGNLAATVEETVQKGDRVVVEGRLQNNMVKNEDGSEKRIVEIDAFGMDKNKRKSCNFCADKVEVIDYKDAQKIRRYLTEAGKILPRRITGTCAEHQRMLAKAVKKAREAALINYVYD